MSTNFDDDLDVLIMNVDEEPMFETESNKELVYESNQNSIEETQELSSDDEDEKINVFINQQQLNKTSTFTKQTKFIDDVDAGSRLRLLTGPGEISIIHNGNAKQFNIFMKSGSFEDYLDDSKLQNLFKPPINIPDVFGHFVVGYVRDSTHYVLTECYLLILKVVDNKLKVLDFAVDSTRNLTKGLGVDYVLKKWNVGFITYNFLHINVVKLLRNMYNFKGFLFNLNLVKTFLEKINHCGKFHNGIGVCVICHLINNLNSCFGKNAEYQLRSNDKFKYNKNLRRCLEDDVIDILVHHRLRTIVAVDFDGRISRFHNPELKTFVNHGRQKIRQIGKFRL